MSRPTHHQYSAIYAALGSLKWDRTVKEELVMSYTNDAAKVSLTDLTFEQASDLVKFLNEKVRTQTDNDKDACNSIRRRIIAIAHQMGWYVRDGDGQLILFFGKKKLDYFHLDNWLITHSKAKKALNDMNKSELVKAAVQINQYYLTTLNAK